MVTGLAIAAGLALGVLVGEGKARLPRALFYASAFAYLTTSIVDFWEHFRLEKLLTGKYLSATAVPVGETVNHTLTAAVLIYIFIAARPLPAVLELRDWLVVAAPTVFLALGWRDEIVYHRRRATHREDIMHTIAHLAAGAMLATFYLLRFAFV